MKFGMGLVTLGTTSKPYFVYPTVGKNNTASDAVREVAEAHSDEKSRNLAQTKEMRLRSQHSLLISSKHKLFHL